jgi:CBS domain-containing protein
VNRDRHDFDAAPPTKHPEAKRAKASRPYDAPPAEVLVQSPVQRRVVFGGGSEPAVSEYVFCKRKSSSVSLGECKGCSRAEHLPDLAHGERSVVCRTEVRYVSRDPDLSERSTRTPLSDLTGRTFACVKRETPWDTLERLFLDEGMDAMPVIDEHGKPIGMITRNDLLRASRDGSDEVTASELPHATHVDTHPDLTAGQMMAPIAQVLPEDAPLSLAIALLAMDETSEVPIVSQSGKVTGLFTTRDALRWLAGEMGYGVDVR